MKCRASRGGEHASASRCPVNVYKLITLYSIAIYNCAIEYVHSVKERSVQMKKIIAISVAAMLCLMLAACVRNGSSGTTAESSEPPVQATSTATAAEPTPTAIVTASGAQAEATPGSIIIAESSNTISDSEKQEILDSLMGEIDSVLGSLDSLEDLDDSDLGTDELN